MDSVILSWNVTNWITVTLMVAVGFMVLALGSQFWQNRQAA